MYRYIIYFLIPMFILLNVVYSEDIYVRLIPEEVVSEGNIIKFNISIENIPKVGDIKYYDGTEDGGCKGVDIYINYSPDYLKPYGFNWSDICKNEKIKSYEFKNGTFVLSILFNKPIEENFYIGEIMFIPTKKGETYVNISGVISSALGIKYDGIQDYYDYYTKTFKKYPKTKFFGAKVIIKEINETNLTNTSLKLSETIEEKNFENIKSTSTSNIINRIYINPQVRKPEVIVKEINITEYRPIVKIIVNKKNDYDISNLFFGIILGIIFGFIFSKFKK